MVGLLTAALVHDLTDAFPRGTWLFVPKGSSPPRSAAFPVQVVQTAPRHIAPKHDDDNGIEVREVHGIAVRLTGPDRTVIDLWRYPRRIPEEFALEALRRRAKLDNFRVPDFARLARRLGAWGRMVLRTGSGGAGADAAMTNDRARAIAQRVANEGRARGLTREDAFTAYAMDRVLFRLGRSRHARGFILKGGVLVGSLLNAPYRFTRDIDVLRRRGPPSPDDLREKFRQVVAVPLDDGLSFGSDAVHASPAIREEDGYDGVKVTIRGEIGRQEVLVRIDVGFGDAVVPPGARLVLPAFLPDDPPARVWAYGLEPVLAEKVETLIGKFPLVRHRLKDLLDVIVLVARSPLDGPTMVSSLGATLARRGTPPDLRVLDDMREQLAGRAWESARATMAREKRVTEAPSLSEAVGRFDTFVRPIFVELREGTRRVGQWEPGGPWQPAAR